MKLDKTTALMVCQDLNEKANQYDGNPQELFLVESTHDEHFEVYWLDFAVYDSSMSDRCIPEAADSYKWLCCYLRDFANCTSMAISLTMQSLGWGNETSNCDGCNCGHRDM